MSIADAPAGALREAVAAARARQRAAILTPLGKRRSLRFTGLLALAIILAGVVLLSLAIGARPIDPATSLRALFAFDPTNSDHLVVHDLRLPRTLTGMAVGLVLAVAGALMQALTRNPLADPGLLGVNAGAALAVVIAIWVLHLTAPLALVWFAMAGAGLVAIAVYALGSLGSGGARPVRLALSGAAINALLFSIVSAILLVSKETLDTYRFWMVGSLIRSASLDLTPLLPFLGAGLLLALLSGRGLNALALGEDTARSLGTRLGLTRTLGMLSLTVLCGAAVAAAGPIGFVGLVVPHFARALTGTDQRWLIAYSALLGPIVLVIADVAGRVILPPGEVQVGIMTALIGGPLFVAIVRNIRLAQL